MINSEARCPESSQGTRRTSWSDEDCGGCLLSRKPEQQCTSCAPCRSLARTIIRRVSWCALSVVVCRDGDAGHSVGTTRGCAAVHSQDSHNSPSVRPQPALARTTLDLAETLVCSQEAASCKWSLAPIQGALWQEPCLHREP